MKVLAILSVLMLPSVALANGGYSQETTHTEPKERCSSYYARPCVNEIEVHNTMPDEISVLNLKPECKPGRAVGAALGVAASIAAMSVGSALTARGFGENTNENRANRGAGIGLMIAGTGGLITSAMAVKRNRGYRSQTAVSCAPGQFAPKLERRSDGQVDSD